MKQTTLVSTGFERHRKSTHRAQFLIQMHQVVPWATLCALIEPHCREGLKSQHLRAAGLKLCMGTIVDASVTSAPNWIQRRNLARDPQRHRPLEIDPCAVPKSHGATP